MNKLKAVLYARVSTEEQVKEGYSIEAQITELKRYADYHGMEIVDEYVVEGKQAAKV